MALKEYEWNGRTYRFEESEAPADAKPVQAEQVKAKQAKVPANKARRAPAKKEA